MTKAEHITTRTMVEYVPHPTCLEQRTCEDCLALSDPNHFKCAWCPKANRCSDGHDPYRPDWDLMGCHVHNWTTACSFVTTTWESVILTTNSALQSTSTKVLLNATGIGDVDASVTQAPTFMPSRCLSLCLLLLVLLLHVTIFAFFVWQLIQMKQKSKTPSFHKHRIH
ncbi:unnamed protein product, partial [Dicrocoelium dendriticum]